MSKPTRRYWLMKTEPDTFSIDDLKRIDVEPWNGVRNYQARNFMRDGMQVGDGVLFYHSNCDVPGVVGLASIASTAYPDPTQFDKCSDYHDPKSTPADPRWLLVDVKFERALKRTITLAEMKASPRLDDFALVQRGTRLSIMPVTKGQYDFILSLEKKVPK